VAGLVDPFGKSQIASFSHFRRRVLDFGQALLMTPLLWTGVVERGRPVKNEAVVLLD